MTKNNTSFLELMYEKNKQAKSDTNEHLPTLKKYSSECNHTTEMGVYRAVSTWGLLAGRPKTLISYDTTFNPNIDLISQAAKEENIWFEFKKENVLDVEIAKTDLLFIDTYHTYTQLKQELAIHAKNVGKYIILHDTSTFGETGEDRVGKGLIPAIDEFLEDNKMWKRLEVFENNNGLTVLGRFYNIPLIGNEDYRDFYNTLPMNLNVEQLLNKISLHYFGSIPESFVEIGVFKGDLRKNLNKDWANVDSLLIDPWKNYSREFYNDEANYEQNKFDVMYDEVNSYWEKDNSVDVLRTTSLEAAAKFKKEGKQFDIVFIDANHSYYSSLSDMQAWLPLVKEGGILCGHDFYDWVEDRWGVQKAVQNYFGSDFLAFGSDKGNVWMHHKIKEIKKSDQIKTYIINPYDSIHAENLFKELIHINKDKVLDIELLYNGFGEHYNFMGSHIDNFGYDGTIGKLLDYHKNDDYAGVWVMNADLKLKNFSENTFKTLRTTMKQDSNVGIMTPDIIDDYLHYTGPAYTVPNFSKEKYIDFQSPIFTRSLINKYKDKLDTFIYILGGSDLDFGWFMHQNNMYGVVYKTAVFDHLHSDIHNRGVYEEQLSKIYKENIDKYSLFEHDTNINLFKDYNNHYVGGALRLSYGQRYVSDLPIEDVWRRTRGFLMTAKFDSVAETKISAVCMVKDVGQFIRPCLDSIKELVDEIIIVDTGSSDDTLSIVKEYGCKIINVPWDNDFSEPRNIGIEEANGNWVLLMDADERLQTELNKLELKAKLAHSTYNWYMGKMVKGSTYYKPRLVSKNAGPKFIGKVHEFLSAAKTKNSLNCDFLNIDEEKSTKTKEDWTNKFNRDISVLRDELKNNALDSALRARWNFYLGESLKNTKKYEEAIVHYEECYDNSAWFEEKFHSALHIAWCYFNSGKSEYIDKIKYWCEIAYGVDARVEPLYLLGKLYKNIKKYKRAIHTWEECLSIEKPTDRKLWVNEDLYYRKILEELGVTYNITKQYKKGLNTYKRLLLDIPEDGRILGNIKWYENAVLNRNKLKIAFYNNVGVKGSYSWGPNDLDTVPFLGGSEIALHNLSLELASLGHEVYVFNNCNAPGVYAGVEWINIFEFESRMKSIGEVDLVISSRSVDIPMVSARKSAIWAHDLNISKLYEDGGDIIVNFDYILVLSKYQLNLFKSIYPFIPDTKYRIIPNGIELERFSDEVVRDEKQLIYTSSADRGLEFLLKAFQDLKEWDAALHLEVYLYGKTAKDLTYSTNYPGVSVHGKASQKDLANAFKKSKLWVYPSDFQETFCISGLEAQAAGTPGIISDNGALPERFSSSCLVVPGQIYELGGYNRFIEATKLLLLNDDIWDSYSSIGKKASTVYTWKNSAKIVENIIKD